MRRTPLSHTQRKDSMSIGTASIDGDGDLDDKDEKDDTKRKCRNLSEKKRRDQFNVLINELSSMVSTTTRKMDKSTVLRNAITFLRSHRDVSPQSDIAEVQENWKPSFLSNEEFIHLMLEALDGFVLVFSCSGKILYTSESIISLMGYLPSQLNSSIFDLIHDSDRPALVKLLNSSENKVDSASDTYVSVLVHMKYGPMYAPDSVSYEVVRLHGTFYNWQAKNKDGSNPGVLDYDSNSSSSNNNNSGEWQRCLVAMARMQTPQLLREMTLSDSSKSEFTSRHSFEWKFLFLDHRAPPIIGYLPFEVLGTSGYDYYHIEDLDRIAASHEALMQTGEGTSCYYRFLTKGQQWIWMQTRYYITYHQWNSKPEFIVCTHTVYSYEEVQANLKKSSKNSVESDARVDSSTFPEALSTPPDQGRASNKEISTVTSSVSLILPTNSSHMNDNTHMVTPLSTLLPDHQVTQDKSGFPQTLTEEGRVLPTSDSTQEGRGLHVLPTQVPTTVITLTGLPQVMELLGTNHNARTEHPPTHSSDSVNLDSAQIQDYLRSRHQLIQQQILAQQEELRRVSEQLMLVQFLPSSQPGPTPPQTTTISTTSTIGPQGGMTVLPSHMTCQEQGVYPPHHSA